MRTRGVPAVIGLLWIVMGLVIIGLGYYAMTSTPFSGLWWGGLVVGLVAMLTGALWLLAALTGWVTWRRRPEPAPVRVRH